MSFFKDICPSYWRATRWAVRRPHPGPAVDVSGKGFGEPFPSRLHLMRSGQSGQPGKR
ncbi:hypothetical protein K470DRAFT_259427 [Piedraia hortae CBS 480.64]|uniref:Uncharacterized protein n=1 Tax=Piedraia hortae CBS 480.64 TaxID=1314780 RepID=A0A6A7BUS0_9PEZI|nr:hypothetical protein K470DRAFT_259427 [Piedraia hortae CBS 480.64]